MAKQQITKILDDLNGEDADETVSFALDGVLYQIDLTGPHAAELRSGMEKFREAAQRVGRVGQGAMTSTFRSSPPPGSIATVASVAARRAANTRIREWASANGFELSERGRIPQVVQDAYENRGDDHARVEQLAAETAPKKTAKKAAPTAAFAHA